MPLERNRCKLSAVAFAAVGVGLIFTVVALSATRKSSSGKIDGTATRVLSEDANVDVSGSEEIFDYTIFEQCSSFKPNIQVEEDFTTKPFWLAMHPFEMNEGIISQLITNMTGNNRGAKNYYRSKNGLKRCIGNGESVTCTTLHPSLALGRGLPDSGLDTYNSKYILVLRNPMTSFPAAHNAKAARYHGAVGQLSEKDWRSARDQWGKDRVEGFKSHVNKWKESKLDLGMYLIYEDFFDPRKGPIIMKKLRSLLLEAGFKVVEEKDLACAWYNALGLENIQRYQTYHYDYEEYIPAYTEAQKKSMLEEMEEFKKESESDLELEELLDVYISEIKEAKTEPEDMESST